jgi:glutathione S-transferase
VVPTLVHDGDVIIDSSVICEYLDEVFPEVSLSPADPVFRAHMRKWLRYFEEVPTPAVRYPSFNLVLIQGFKNLSETEFEGTANSRPLRKHFYKQMGQDGFSKKEIDKAIEDIANTVDRMEKALAAGGPWLMGEQFTIADVCVVPSIDRMEDLGFENIWEANHPLVTDWFRRFKTRPSFQEAYYKGARFSDIYPDLNLGRSKPEVRSA